MGTWSGLAVLLAVLSPGVAAAAGNSFILPDGTNRAPAVVLHCVASNGTATPCGTAASPLAVTAGPNGSSATNQQQQIAAEQLSAQGIGGVNDPAFAGGAGSMIAVLKGVWGAVSNGIPALPASGTLISHTTALAAATSVQVFPANPGRHYLSFQVPQGSAVWLNVMGGVASPNGPDCAYFAAGTFYESGQFINRGAITVYAPIAVMFSAWED